MISWSRRQCATMRVCSNTDNAAGEGPNSTALRLRLFVFYPITRPVCPACARKCCEEYGGSRTSGPERALIHARHFVLGSGWTAVPAIQSNGVFDGFLFMLKLMRLYIRAAILFADCRVGPWIRSAEVVNRYYACLPRRRAQEPKLTHTRAR